MLSIGQLKVGDKATVTGFVEAGAAYRRKLLAMGLTKGVEINLLRIAPMGDPVEIQVRGFSLSLRKEEAAVIQVEKV